ncbi:hypothetical protein SLNSH_02780 [Alsobacter soli]|uniref:DUF3467 domain-containing protein n=1 Tax=Alsobacter soli TaxID=2109933 RepID=A0A2T1HYT1_9HYPH|nr:hypothetical protein [Alsobacter soli]PSC06738.1 hypothetical protein SLNSH_02780 [Alsobacter soli]
MAQTAETMVKITPEMLKEMPRFYVNGFQNSLSNADVTIAFVQNGIPEVAINMSYTTAKTLAVMLGQLVAQLEEATGREIMTTQVIDQSLAEFMAKGSASIVRED